MHGDHKSAIQMQKNMASCRRYMRNSKYRLLDILQPITIEPQTRNSFNPTQDCCPGVEIELMELDLFHCKT